MNYNKAELCKDCKMPVKKESIKEALAKLKKLARKGHGDYEERTLLQDAIRILERVPRR